MRIKWYFNFYHKTCTNLPVIVLLSLICFLYYIYVSHYVLVLIEEQETEMFTSLIKIQFQDTEIAGKILLAIITWSAVLCIIGILRTAFMDPGFVYSVLDMENRLITKNIDVCTEENETCLDVRDKLKNDTNAESKGVFWDSQILDVSTYMKKVERSTYITNFSNNITEGPLTSSDLLRHRGCLQKIISIEEGEDFNKTDTYNSEDKIKYKTNINAPSNYNAEVSKINLCNTCMRWKPERTHHCKQCGKCILKMDHHCPWLANCIGFKNQKYFCLVVLYGFVSSATMFITFWEPVLSVNTKFDTDISTCVLYSFTYILNFAMLAFTSYLFIINWDSVMNNTTAIEKFDKTRFSETGFHNHYNIGYYNNFKSVFGNNPLFWFLPIAPNYKGDGIVFETKHII